MVWPIQSTQKLQPNTLIFTESDIKSRVLGQYKRTQKLQPNTLIFTESNIESRVLGQYKTRISGYNKQFSIRKTSVKNMNPEYDGTTTTKSVG